MLWLDQASLASIMGGALLRWLGWPAQPAAA